MSRNHSVVSAKGIIRLSLVGLNIMVLIAALIISSYLLVGTSIAISLAILALFNSRQILTGTPGSDSLLHTAASPEPDYNKQTIPLGIQDYTTISGHEWLANSMYPTHIKNKNFRVLVGNAQCNRPYSLSLLNIGGMTSTSLDGNTVAALNHAAALGDFAHNTGGSAILPHHLNGGDLVWQIGSDYSGCRDNDGQFSAELFKINAAHPKVKMIELKLPLRNRHAFITNPVEMVQFLGLLRLLSGGKPVGFNICVGNKHEFIDICNAIQVTRIIPDFMTIEGAEGNTSHLSVGCSGHIGIPLYDSLAFVKQTLEIFNIREHIRIIAAGKIATAFDILKVVALGADACYSSGGSLPALDQNLNSVKVAVANFHTDTMTSFIALMEAGGFGELKDINPTKFFRRIDALRTRNFQEIYFNHIDERLRDGWFKACMLN